MSPHKDKAKYGAAFQGLLHFRKQREGHRSVGRGVNLRVAQEDIQPQEEEGSPPGGLCIRAT